MTHQFRPSVSDLLIGYIFESISKDRFSWNKLASRNSAQLLIIAVKIMLYDFYFKCQFDEKLFLWLIVIQIAVEKHESLKSWFLKGENVSVFIFFQFWLDFLSHKPPKTAPVPAVNANVFPENPKTPADWSFEKKPYQGSHFINHRLKFIVIASK